MAKQFNVSIILKVLQEGVEGAVNLFSNLNKQLDSTDKGTKKIKDSLRGLKASDAAGLLSAIAKAESEVSGLREKIEQVDLAKIGGKDALITLRKLLKDLRKDVDLKLDINASAGIEELRLLEQRLNAIIKLAGEADNVELFGQFSGLKAAVTDARKELEKMLKAQNDLERKPAEIRLKLSKDFPKIKKDIDEFRKDFETSKELGLSVDFKADDATKKLNAIIQRIKDLRAAAVKVGDDPLKFDVELGRIQDLKDELKRIGPAKDRLAREAISIKVANLNDLKDLDKEVRKILVDLEAAKKAGNIKLVAELDTKRGELQKQLSNLKKPIDDLAASSRKTALVDTFEGIQNKLNAAAKSAQNFGTAEADAAQKAQVANQKISGSLSDVGIEARRLEKQIEEIGKSGNFTLVPNIEKDVKQLEASVKAFGASTLDTKQQTLFTKIKADVENAVDALGKLKTINLGDIEDNLIDSKQIGNALKKITSDAKSALKDLGKGVDEGNEAAFRKIINTNNELIGQINKIKSSGQVLSKEQFRDLIAAEAVVDELSASLRNVTIAAINAGNDTQQANARLANSFGNISKNFKDLQTRLLKFKEIGESVTIRPKIEIETDSILAELKTALLEAQRLGKDTTAIRLKIEQVEQFKADLNTITQQADELAKKKILIKPVLAASYEEVDRRLSELNRELDAAKKKGDFRVIIRLQSELDELQSELSKVEAAVKATNDKAQIQIFQRKQLGLDLTQRELTKFANSSEGTLNKLRGAFRLAAQDAGGARGAITGLASTFRLVGTSAFLVGGELRTLGFGFSAFANIIQNIGPVVFQFAAGLAKAGPAGLVLLTALTAVATTASVVAGKLLLITGSLGALIDAGFEYNTALEQTKNASAALAQEFFDFSVNGEKVNETIEVGGKLLTKYQVAQLAVEQQFTALQTAALSTIFTNRELLGTFQNIILASKGLAPSLESVTALTGQFARVAGLIGISADKLASQVNLVLSGAGRVTSPLQRFLNAAKDSQGIELTAKRIKQLRAEGGDVLFAELTSAISKFDEALKQANRTSFTGVISNLRDVFEQISQLSTKTFFNNLRDGLADVVDRLTQKVQVLKDDGTPLKDKAGVEQFDVRPSKALLGIAETASKIFDVINRDIIKLVNFLVDKLGDLDNFLKSNYKNIVNIYESSKDVLITIIKIVDIFGKLFTLSSDTNSQLSATVTILDGVVLVAQVFRGTIAAVGLIISEVVGSLALLPELFLRAAAAGARLKDSLINGGEKTENTKELEAAAGAVTGFRERRFAAGKNFFNEIDASTREGAELLSGKTGADRNRRIVENEKKSQTQRILENFESRAEQIRSEALKGKITPQQRKEKLDKLSKDITEFRTIANEDLSRRLSRKEGIDLGKFEPKQKITSVGTGKGTAEDAEKKGRKRAAKSELADKKALFDEIRKLGIQREKNELDLIKNRLDLEKTLTEAALDQNIISQQAASKKILDIKNQEISNEITTRRNAIALLNAERIDKELSFQAERQDIISNAANTNENSRVTKSKLDVLDLKQSADIIANTRERVALEGEIASLNQSRNVAAFEYLRTLQTTQTENRKLLEDQERSLVDAQDLNNEATLRFRLLDLVRSKIEDIINLENQAEGIQALIGSETDQNVIAILTKQLELIGKRRLLIEQEISVRQRLLQIQSADNLISELKNKLSFKEAELGRSVATGLTSERDATIKATAERIKYKEALQEAIEVQEQLLNAPITQEEPALDSAKLRENIARLKQELRELKTEIDDRELISASNSIKDNFVSLFDSLQDGSKSAAESFADLGRSILGTFRNLISKRLVEELFGSLFPTPGQTEGKVTGIFGKIFEKIGLGTAKQDQQKADEIAKTSPSALSPEQRALLDTLKKTATEGNAVLVSSITDLAGSVRNETSNFRAAMQTLADNIRNAGVVIGIRNPESAKGEASKILGERKRLGSTATEEALGTKPVPVNVKNIELNGVEKGTVKTATTGASKSIGEFDSLLSPKESVSTKPQNLGVSDKLSLSIDRIFASIDGSANRIISEIGRAANLTQNVSILNSGNIIPAISGYFNSLITTIGTSIGTKLDEVIRLLSTSGSVSSSVSPLEIFGGAEGEYKGGVIRRAFGGLAGFISGGAIKGSGGLRDDSIPARLSNGEYVIQAPVVKSIGEKFFDFVNATGKIPALAKGGALFTNVNRPDYVPPTIDTTKFNYTGGGASLLKKPDLIAQPTPPKPKKIGGLRKFFGNLLGAIAPFLNFIPVVGPFLAIGAGAAGGALLGEDKKSSIIGGILGGLGNAGGLGKFGGALGKFGNFFGSSGKGGQALGLFNGLLGSKNPANSFGSGAGNLLKGLLQKFGKLRRATGGIVKLASGGSLSSIFSGSGKDSTSQLALLFGLSTLLGGLTNSSQKSGSEFVEVVVDDPDADRKNKYGSAYNPLIDEGRLAGYKYNQETLTALLKQQEGYKNLIRAPKKSGFLGFITQLLPIIGGLVGSLKLGSGAAGSLKNSGPTGFNRQMGDVFAAGGGLIKRLAGGGSVQGSGTSTSDSIPAMLSNGEYVIKASSVRMLGTDILDSINAGRFAFADGGLVAPGLSSLPEVNVASASPNVNVDNTVKVLNFIDPNLLQDYLKTSDGQRTVINLISKNKKSIKESLR